MLFYANLFVPDNELMCVNQKCKKDSWDAAVGKIWICEGERDSWKSLHLHCGLSEAELQTL